MVYRTSNRQRICSYCGRDVLKTEKAIMFKAVTNNCQSVTICDRCADKMEEERK